MGIAFSSDFDARNDDPTKKQLKAVRDLLGAYTVSLVGPTDEEIKSKAAISKWLDEAFKKVDNGRNSAILNTEADEFANELYADLYRDIM